MAEWDPLAIVILVLLGAIAVMGVVLGIWIWYRGRQLSKAEYRECILKQRVGQLEREAQTRVIESRMKGLTNAEAIADFDDRDPVIFDDTGEG